jgi:hypothetical protein
MQAQMLQTMQQTMTNIQQAQGHQPAPQPQQRDKLGEFQRTKPPTFSHSIEPMDADDWLKTIKKKLQVVQCNNREKVLCGLCLLLHVAITDRRACLSGPFSPNLPLLRARVATPAKLPPSSWPPITTSVLPCCHLCACSLEPSHRLLMPCSIVSTLPPLCYRRR